MKRLTLLTVLLGGFFLVACQPTQPIEDDEAVESREMPGTVESDVEELDELNSQLDPSVLGESNVSDQTLGL